ncbi:F-box protein At2g26160-like [Dioscorea cayenensis subsp. rotundata]|uniref:F-box protein At2g26160-like n=1 Tax=Dioscorea cayennensis subsp. rotundata TaxID=55577 RepID=A0AB40AL11_DIOCR|nr:F-box protein At2g26160-like [Dioscorea cayenensis subsp. rotundata]
MFLLNPFSKTQIELPSLLLSEEEYGTFKDVAEDTNRPTHEVLLDRLVLKAALLADPEKCSDYVIMVTSHSVSELKFWRSSDPSWSRIENPDRMFFDVIWYKGAFHALSLFNEVFEICLSPNLKLKQIACAWGLEGFCRYLVDCMGDLLIVNRITDETYTMHLYTRAFLVFKLDEKVMEFIKVKSIRDHALFLGRNSTIAIPANEFPGCLSNSIYFMDDLAVTSHEYGYEDFGLYNMRDKIFEIFPPKDVYTTSKFQPLWLEACP